MEKQLLANAPLSVLNKLGYLSPTSFKNVWVKIWVISLSSFVGVVIFMQNFYANGDIFSIIDNVEFLVGVGQTSLRIVLIMINRDKILNLVELRQNFWRSEECTTNTKIRIDKILSAVSTIQKMFLYFLLFYCFVLVASVYIIGQELPYGTWNMTEYTKLYQVAAPACSVCIFTICVFWYCFEGIFLGFCYEIVVQFKILCDHLERMKVGEIESALELENFYSRLNVYIEHHKFLRSYTNAFQDYYSSIFMVEFATATPMICLLFYAARRSQNLATVFKYGFAGFLAVLQFCFYCIPLATLSEEVTSVSTAIYNSDWYSKHYMKLKKSTLLMLQQAQQEIRFTAWGLVELNPPTLVDTLKLAFSTSTFLSSLDK